MICVTTEPMTKGQFDAAIGGLGWVRKGINASNVTAPRVGDIIDIDKVPAANGKRHIMFEANLNNSAAFRDLMTAVPCIDDDSEEFWTLLGIDREY